MNRIERSIRRAREQQDIMPDRRMPLGFKLWFAFVEIGAVISIGFGIFVAHHFIIKFW